MLRLTPEVYDGMVAHARRGVPEEVCGVLGGRYDDEESLAVEARQAENVAATPRSEYRIDPAEQLELMEELEESGNDVVGFYHSHPVGPPRPSNTDRMQATWQEYSYLIVVLDGETPYVGSWRWTGEDFHQETLRRE